MIEPTQGMAGEMLNDVVIEDLAPTLQMLAGIVGLEGALRISAEYGGMNIYIPKLENSLVKPRERAIVRAFTGENYQDLARKFKVSDRYVRAVVEKARKAIRKAIGATVNDRLPL